MKKLTFRYTYKSLLVRRKGALIKKNLGKIRVVDKTRLNSYPQHSVLEQKFQLSRIARQELFFPKEDPFKVKTQLEAGIETLPALAFYHLTSLKKSNA